MSLSSIRRRAFPTPYATPAQKRRSCWLRFVETRRLTGYESALREVFTSPRKGKEARTVDRACLDALVESTQDAASTAHFLADIATRNKPLRTSPLCAEGLKRLGPAANAVLLERLSIESRKVQRRKLALLLVKVSRTGMPEPLPFWSDAPPAELTEALARWRTALEEKGRLP